jgi:PAS domain S-box-containing protein
VSHDRTVTHPDPVVTPSTELVISSFRSPRWFAWAAVLAAVQALVLLASEAAVGTLVNAATWWPSVGTATAIVVLSGGAHWPAVVTGLLLALLVSPGAVVDPLLSVAVVLAQALGVRWLLRRALGEAIPRLDATRDVGILISRSFVAALGVNAAAGLLPLVLDGGNFNDLFTGLASAGSSGALGAYLVLAMTLSFNVPDDGRVANAKARLVIVSAILLALAGAGFLSPWHWKGVTGTLIIIAIPVVIWAAIHLGARTTLVLGVLLAILATTGTMLGRGALAAPERSLLERELIANLYVYMTTALSLTILAAISERERALRSAEEARRRLQMVLEHSTAAITLYQADGEQLTCVDLNSRTADILFAGDMDAARAAMIGRSRDEVAPILYTDADSAAKGTALLREAVITRRPAHETIILDGPGDTRTFDTTYTPVFDGDGRLTHLLAASHDVSERQRAATALAHSEARFRRIFESTVLGVFSWNDSGAITDANESFLEMLGYTRADLESGRLDWKLLTPPEYAELNELKHAEVRVIGHCSPFEKEYLRKDGGRVTVLVASSLWAPGADEGFATIVDITSRRQAEKALRSITHGTSALTGEAFFHQLVRELHEALGADHVLVATLEGEPAVRAQTIAAWSGHGYTEPFGYELAGTPCEAVAMGELCYFGSGVSRLYPDDQLLSTLGVECYLGVPLVDADGAPTGILAVMHGRPLDRPEWAQTVLNVFAARAAAELQRLGALNLLRASEERLATVFDTVSDRLSLWSVDDDGRTRLVSVNRTGRAAVQEHSEGTWTDAYIGGDMVTVLRSLFEGLGGAAPDQVEEALLANRESLRALLTAAEPVGHEESIEYAGGLYASEVELIPVPGDNGRITHILRSAKDITDRVRAEAARSANEARDRQSQKLEAIGTLAGGIAHDFNNILTGIIGNAELARGELPDGHEAIDRLDEVVRAVHRARNVVRQIVTFSRREDGARQPIRLADVIAENFELLRASVPSSATIATRVEAPDAMVLADAGQIALVLMNLCSNAAHAVGDRGGCVTITQDVVPVSDGHAAVRHGVKPGEYARLVVEDDGTGMDDEVLRRIFDPYFTTKPPGEGTGLGLPVVHGISRAHGGAVIVQSSVGVGTRVEVLLPRIATVGEPRRAAGDAVRGRGEHVFLVDDETAIIDVGQRLLRRLGYQVSAYLDPQEALVAFELDPGSVQLVVSDLTMPGLNGLNLARRIAALRPGVPFILTTGYAAELLDEVGSVPSIVEVLDKPFDRDTIARAVRAALDGQTASPKP